TLSVTLPYSATPARLRVCLTATPPPELYTLSLHDALPICTRCMRSARRSPERSSTPPTAPASWRRSANRSPPISPRANRLFPNRSEEHTSELQSPDHLVCRLLLEKKKKKQKQKPNQYNNEK